MTDVSINAVHALNRFVYDLLKSNGALSDRSAYGGRTPILSAQQEPTIIQYNLPFLVYGFTESASTEFDALVNGNVAYAIYSAEEKDIIKITNIMREEFKHFDDTARDVNLYKYANAAFRDILFTSISVGLVEGPSPATTEGGRQSGVVMLRYTYQPDYRLGMPGGIIVPTTMT
jgi:hypothetical protein